MYNANELDDPTGTARLALAAEDRKYWLAHPELQGLVAHFTAKALQNRPSDIQAFASETFSDPNLKEQVQQAMARNGGRFGHDQQLHEAAGASARRARQDDGNKRRNPKDNSSRDRSSREKSPKGKASSSGKTTSRAKTC